MRKFLFSLFLVGIISLAACQNNSSKNATQGNSSAPATAASDNSSKTTDGRNKSLAKIVAFGDSLTAGYGLQPSQSYPTLLQKRLDAEGYEYEVVNAGISGDTSAGGVRRIDWSLEDNVKIVIVELGANDILRLQPIEDMKKNLSTIIEKSKAKGAKVLLAGMEAPTNSGADYRKAAREAFPALAKEHQIALIPFFLEGVAGIESLNQNDGIHPNVEGTKLVVDTVYKNLRPLLEKQEKTQTSAP
jgi:acyl-CoA thioesterase-1